MRAAGPEGHSLSAGSRSFRSVMIDSYQQAISQVIKYNKSVSNIIPTSDPIYAQPQNMPSRYFYPDLTVLVDAAHPPVTTS